MTTKTRYTYPKSGKIKAEDQYRKEFTYQWKKVTANDVGERVQYWHMGGWCVRRPVEQPIKWKRVKLKVITMTKYRQLMRVALAASKLSKEFGAVEIHEPQCKVDLELAKALKELGMYKGKTL